MTPLIRLVVGAVLPIALLISMSHLIEAEQGPGDGFTAGIITALGLTLDREAFHDKDRRGLFRRLRYDYVLASGLALTLAAALLPMPVGGPLLGPWNLRATLFDLGIYLVVAGGAMTAILSLRKERE